MPLPAAKYASAFESPAEMPTASFAPVGQVAGGQFDEELCRLLRSRLILVHLLALLYVALLKVLTLSTPGGNTLTEPDQGNP